MRSISAPALCFIVCLVCLHFPAPCTTQTVLPSQSCNNSNLNAGNALLTDDLIPKLRFLQRILDQNFSIPDAPTLLVHHNATQNSVTISVSNFASFTQTFHISYYADIGIATLSNVTTIIVNAIKDDNFMFRGSMILSASNNFVPQTRYLFSAIARVNSLNLQSSPSALVTLDYLPSFNVVDTIASISADSTPLFLDIVTRYFKQGTFITLVMRDLGVNINVTFTGVSADRLPSNVFLARVGIPELFRGGSYQLVFNNPVDRITITRSLFVRPPFRIAFRSISPASIPLAGAIVRILLTNVTEPLLAAATFFSFQSSPSVSFAVADAVEASSTGPLDFFVTFRMPNVSLASTLTVVIRPNNNAKAATSFNVVYTAVRLISSLPISYLFPRIGIIRVTVAVDVGIPTLSSVSFTGAAASRHTTTGSRVVSQGVYEYTIQLQASIAAGSYTGTLSISANSQTSDIKFPVNVVTPPTPTIVFDPATIFDDGSSGSRVSIIVRDIGDISSSSDLTVNCSFPSVNDPLASVNGSFAFGNGSFASVCRCTVESFSLSFASITCILRGRPGRIEVTVNNTNVIGYGIMISGFVDVRLSTTPRVLAVSTDRLSQLGRYPVAIAVTNFLSVDRIRINGVQYNSNSSFFLVLSMFRPFTRDEEFRQAQIVKQLYPQERIFEDAFFTVVSRLQSFSNNATILLFRMPRVSNFSIVVEIEQMSPGASVVANFPGVALSNSPFISTSVSRISMQGGTNVVVNLNQYIPITQQSDIDIICSLPTNSTLSNFSVLPTLVRATTSDAVFQFQSPTLSSTADMTCAIVSRIDLILGLTALSASFTLSVFDPRSLTLVDSSQTRFYSIGGPRVLSVNVRFWKGSRVSARANLVECAIVSTPSLDDSRLNPDAIQNFRMRIPEFPSLVGNINVEIQSGSEMLFLTVSLVASPTSPVLTSIQSNMAIPSQTNTVLITAVFQEFIASANTSSFMVFVPSLANFSVSPLNISSDFQRTIVSFRAPQLINMSDSQQVATFDAFVADLSSACGRELSCVGRFTLQYINVNLASFVSMAPLSGLPSVSTRVTVLLTNVQISNVSLVTVSVADPHKADVSTAVIGATFGGIGISSETVVIFLITWIANTRPSASVNIPLTIVLGRQSVTIPTAFRFLPDNQPQLMSVSPSSIFVFGGLHFAVFMQPASFGFRSASVLIDGAVVASNFSANGDLISFSSPRVSNVRVATVAFTLVGASLTVTLSSTLFYTAPPPVVIKSIFPSQLSSFGSSSQVRLMDVPSFWSLSSAQTSLIQGSSSTPCAVNEFIRTNSEVILSISCPALNPGFGNLEIFDASAVSSIARSLSLSIVNPTAPQFVSILPSQLFSSKLSLMTLIVRNFPVGLSARVTFLQPAPLLDIPVTVLSSFFEPSNSSTTVATILVNAPSSVNVFAVSVSVTASNGLTISCTSPFLTVVDDSVATIVSLKPSSLQSIGGSIEVLVSGLPPSLLPSDFSATFSIENSLRIAVVSSCSYNSDGRAIVVVIFPMLDIASSVTVTVFLSPQKFESKSVFFPINVQKLQPSVGSVVPSVISDAGGDRLAIRLLYFPVTTQASFVTASFGGITASLSVFLVSSRPDLTVIELQTPFLNVSASGSRELIVSYVLAPSISLTAPVVIQVTSRASLVHPVVPAQMIFNTTATIPITVAFSAVDFRKFNDFAVGSSFNSASTTLAGESLCFSIILRSNQGAIRCSDFGCLVASDPVSDLTNYRILSKNLPYQGCISFGVQYIANAAPNVLSPSPRAQELSVLWNSLCNTPVPVGITSFNIVRALVSLSPSTGAVSGGYVISLSVSGITSSGDVLVYFGSSMAVISSQTILGSVLLLSVICPVSTRASVVDVLIQSGSNTLATSKFNYVLGCLDYDAFCSGLQGGYVPNIRFIGSDPPSASECSVSYCISTSSISAPVLVMFPSKQSTSIATIAFSVRNLFALSGSQIRVAIGNGNTLLPVLTSRLDSATNTFSVTVQAPSLFESSSNTIWVYSSNSGPSLNASFILTSLVPISGPIRVVSVSPSVIPFEGTSSLRISVSNFPYNSSFPVVTFVISAQYNDARQNFTVQSSLFHEFGNGSISVGLQPSSIINATEILRISSSGHLLNVTVQAAGLAVNSSVFFQVGVMQRVNRQILSMSALNSATPSRFRSVAGTVISIAIQGFDGPDITTCVGFRSSAPTRVHLCDGERNCFITRNAVSHSDRINIFSIPYPRDFFTTLTPPSLATEADLTVRIYDSTGISCLGTLPSSSPRIVECGTAPNLNCLQIVPASLPSLQSEPPSFIPFITIRNDGIISGSQIVLSFSNFFAPTDFVTARIGSDSGANAFPTIQDGCTFLSCRISVIVGGNVDDASLVGSTDGLSIFVRARNITLPVKIARITAPAPIASPSLVSSSGGSIITVTSYSFSQVPNNALYAISNPAFSIIRVSKVGNFTTVFELRLMTPLQVGSQSISISSTASKVITENLILEIFPSMTLNNPLVSECLAGSRRVQILVSNLPTSLNEIELSVTFNNVLRPAIISSSSTLNFSFPCDEIVASQAPLSVTAVVSGSIRQASTLIIVPPLPLSVVFVVGDARFPMITSQPVAQASTLCSSNAAARSNSRCRTAIVNTELRPGMNIFLDVVPVGSSISAMSINIFVISSSPGSSLFSFVFDPSADTTPSGFYNLVLSANFQTTSIIVSVFNPAVSAICLAPAACSLNSNVGGVVTVMLVNFLTVFGSVQSGDLGFSVSKLDGTTISSLKPQLTAFSSAENRLSVQINRYLAASEFRNGQMAVSLNIVLMSSPSTSASIRIVLRLEPDVLSVDFTESLTSLIITLNQPVITRVSITNCVGLFANSTVVRFGKNPVCAFSSDSTISVQFGSDASVVTGDFLDILPGIIIPSDGFPFAHVALSPSVASVPSTFRKSAVEIQGTQYVEGCPSANPATINAIAYSPRPFASVTWSCPACSNDAVPLTSFLSVAQALFLAIPADIIIRSKCRIDTPCGVVVTVVDFIGRRSLSAPFFIYGNPNPVPDLQFAPLEFPVYYPDITILLRTRFQFSTCFGDTASAPVFSWSVSPSPVLNVSSTGPRLLLSPNSLLPGLYQVTVTVLLDGASVSAVQTLVISQRAIVASLSAPNAVSSRSNVTLDASRSRDLDTSIRRSVNLLFSWFCIYENKPCLDSFGSRLLLPQRSGNHSILSLPASTLLIPSTISELNGSKFFFYVEVSSSSDVRVASSSAEVVVVQDIIPTVVVAASSTVLNSGSRISVGLSASITPFVNAALVWSEISGLIPGGITAVLDPAFKVSDLTIVINSTLLVPGRPYVFQAALASNARAAGIVSISVNPGPSSGRCFIASVQNGAVSSASCRLPNQCNVLSRVQISCVNWMDDNLPLKYQIGYQSLGGTETRLDYSPDATSTIQMPIGIQNLFVDVCDSLFACSSFASFVENPIIISQAILSTEQQNSIAGGVTKSIQSGDVDGFCSALTVSISYLRSTQPPSSRRLLQSSAVTLQTAPALISSMALKTVDIGAAIILSQTLSSLAQASRDFDAASASTVLRSMVRLSALFSPALLDETSTRASSTQIDTAAKATANILSSLSNVGAITAETNFQNMKRAEMNLARAILQNAQLNQVLDVSSTDQQYALRATSVLNNAAVFIRAPTGSGADFGFSLNVVDGSSTRVLSSFAPRAKYASSVPQGAVLMSDVADCTVIKEKGTNSASIKSGSELGTVTIKIPFNLTSSGSGSHAALSQDPTSVKIAFYDEAVSPPVWKDDGCRGTVELLNTASAMFTGTCSHLTTFGIIAAPPAAPPATPPPNPNTPPGPAVKADSPSSPEEFPLWAIIFIPVAGGVALLSVGGFFTYKRITGVRTRGRQIVAASAWKSLANVTSIPKPPAKPTALLAVSPNPVNADSPAKAPVNPVKTPDVGSLVALSRQAEVSLPVTPVTPSVSSKLSATSPSVTSSTASRRQELADRVAAEAGNNVSLIEMSPLNSNQQRIDAIRSKHFSAASSQRGSSAMQNTVSSVLQRRREQADLVSEQPFASSSSQLSPTRLPGRLAPATALNYSQTSSNIRSRSMAPAAALSQSQTSFRNASVLSESSNIRSRSMAPASALSQYQTSPRNSSVLSESASVRSRSSSRSRSGLASPFFAEQSSETNEVSPRSFQSSVNRARSPLPSTQNRSKSAVRATSAVRAASPLESGGLFGSMPAGRYTARSVEGAQSQSPLTSTYRSNVSPSNAEAPFLVSSASTRSASRQGFRMPGTSPHQGLGTRYDQA